MFDGLFGGMFGLVSNLINSNLASQTAQAQMAANKELAEMQNQFNIDMWNRNNEYNTPKNQLQRLVDAGLSPNLAYGGVSTGNSSAPVTSAQIRPASLVPRSIGDLGQYFGSAVSDIFNLFILREKLKQEQINTKDAEMSLYDKGQMLSGRAGVWTAGDNGFDRLFNVIPGGLATFYNNLATYDSTHRQNRAYGEGLSNTYQLLRNQLLEKFGFKKADAELNHLYVRNRLLNLQNDFYKADKYFNYAERGLNQIWRGFDTFSKPRLMNMFKAMRGE